MSFAMAEAPPAARSDGATIVGDVSCGCGFEYRFAAVRDRWIRFWPKIGQASYRPTPLDASACLRCGSDLRGRAAVRDLVGPWRPFVRVD
jgi:hypothetical protein